MPEPVRAFISFIVPALNEERNIGRSIDSIEGCLKPGGKLTAVSDYEIIVVDNGSTDRTREICLAKGARFLSHPGLTVGALRNTGAEAAKGEVLVFIDADVSLTPGWSSRLPALIRFLEEKPLTVTGSRVKSDDSASYSIRQWFSIGKGAAQANYINSGHMIIRKDVFTSLGGFNQALVSGEDSELCQRAAHSGISITPLDGLDAIHNEAPASLFEFFKRERWHGYGDYQSFSNFRKSRPAMMAALNVLAILSLSTIFLIYMEPSALIVYFFILTGLSALSGLHRNKFRIDRKFPVFIYMYMVYITARSLSLFDFLLGLSPGRWR
ncbi:MAG: glycosyltransferase [Thermodesulfobacteriota bacterium]|nr:MAG: glycosyltransferase [Thermodesulfobacteriota bacterium]